MRRTSLTLSWEPLYTDINGLYDAVIGMTLEGRIDVRHCTLQHQMRAIPSAINLGESGDKSDRGNNMRSPSASHDGEVRSEMDVEVHNKPACLLTEGVRST